MKKTLQFLLFFALTTTLTAQTNVCDELNQILKPKSVKRTIRIVSTTDVTYMTMETDTFGNFAMTSKTGISPREIYTQTIVANAKMYIKIGNEKNWFVHDIPKDQNRSKEMALFNILDSTIQDCKKMDNEMIDNVIYKVYSFEADLEKISKANSNATFINPVKVWISPKYDLYKMQFAMEAINQKIDMTMVYTYDIPVNIQVPLPQNVVVMANLDTLPQLKKHSPSTDGVYTIVDQQPEFPGGQRELFKYLHSNIKYPAEARSKGIKGTVYIGFVIDTDGSITDIGIKRGLSKDINEEAMRVIASMPKWAPGIDQGKVVKVAYTLPINFKM